MLTDKQLAGGGRQRTGQYASLGSSRNHPYQLINELTIKYDIQPVTGLSFERLGQETSK